MKEIVAILHDIRSIHNVGSIFRTAEAAGVKKIYLTGITPEPVDRFGRYRPQFVKVSLGAEKMVEWEKAKSIYPLLKKLKENRSFKIFAVEQAKNSRPYYKIKKNEIVGQSVGFVVGNEIRGLPARILRSADEILEIPIRGRKESLNVAVAFGIVVYHFAFGYNKKRVV